MGGMTDADPSTSPDRAPDSVSAAGAAGTEGVGSVPATIWDHAADLFTQWREGRTRAMDDLVRLMTPVLWHVVRAYGLDAQLSEDVVQVTWLTLVRRHDTIHDVRAVAGWLTTCARREAWRAGRAQQRVRATDDADLEPLIPADDSAESRAHIADRDRRLWSAVTGLDARCGRLLRVIAFEERPDYAHLARDLNMPIGSIGPTRGRCLGKLRAALEAAGWNGDDRDL